MATQKLHYFSGLVLSLFIGIHLFNHCYGILGAAQHIALMDSLRLVYRNMVVECLLLGAAGVQVVSGLLLVRKRRGAPKVGWDRWHIASGLYLAFFLLLHTTAVLSGRMVMHLDTNYYFGAAGMNAFPTCLFFIPYYVLAIMAVAVHVASIHSKKATRAILGISPHQQALGMVMAGAALTIVVLYAMTNGFSGVEVPEGYRVLQGR